ncbi:hypothetical protein TNCV_5037561 [Trichonephila clavipes]|nr:hypothetical protein TNCV_5037561 [Trichonephila clavipes]
MPGKRTRRHFSQLSEFERPDHRDENCRLVDAPLLLARTFWDVQTQKQILNPCALFRALPLTPEHRQLRLHWCQARSMWNVTDWQKVVFSDESRFVLGTDDNRVRDWRHPGERYNSPHSVLRHTARTAGVMVWGP